MQTRHRAQWTRRRFQLRCAKGDPAAMTGHPVPGITSQHIATSYQPFPNNRDDSEMTWIWREDLASQDSNLVLCDSCPGLSCANTKPAERCKNVLVVEAGQRWQKMDENGSELIWSLNIFPMHVSHSACVPTAGKLIYAPLSHRSFFIWHCHCVYTPIISYSTWR